jgi:hypothetical protein
MNTKHWDRCFLLAIAFFVLVAGGCGGGGGGGVNSEFAISPKSLNIQVGDSRQIAASGFLAPLKWVSDNPAVAEVNASGASGAIVQALSEGTANILVEDGDGQQLTCSVTVSAEGTPPSPPASSGINGTWRIDSGTYNVDNGTQSVSASYKPNSAKAPEFEVEVKNSSIGQGYDIILSGFGVVASGFPVAEVWFEWETSSGGTSTGSIYAGTDFVKKADNIYLQIVDQPGISLHAEYEYSLIDNATLKYRALSELEDTKVEYELLLKRIN